MLVKMSECNVTQTLKTEIRGTFRWESRKEGDQLLAKCQTMGPLATKLHVTANNSDQITYYGISIPNDVNGSEECLGLHVYTDKTQALKIVKKFKKARFKAFKSKQEALEFAAHGHEILTVTSPGSGESVELTSPAVGEKPSPFKGPKAQDLVHLRKVIESGNLPTFKTIVWENPRYLVSSGDTPSILQEGSRYNALHVAAKAKNAEICDLILQTVGNVKFIQLLYGDDDIESCQDRARILLDLYLNTPDKALNETPLHFAVKFGALAVAEVLLSYPSCDKFVTNKFGQTPKDVICSRVSSQDMRLLHELSVLLDDRYYVPVLRSADNSVQPLIGEPFSPVCPLVLKASPISPRIEIRAYAGPMARDDAVNFRKKWKTPPRMLRTPVRNASSPCSQDFRLQDTEKGLERVGRDLAQEFKVAWNEYWPFLDTFTNLSSKEGLEKLEDFLRERFHNATTKQLNDEPKKPMKRRSMNLSGDDSLSELCNALKACMLTDESPGRSQVRNEVRTVGSNYDCRGYVKSVGEDEAFLNVLLSPGLSPFLYVEKSCQVFAKRISDGLNLAGALDMLQAEARHLQDLVCSYRDDPRFISVDFNLIHSRIAAIVGQKLQELASEEMESVIEVLKSVAAPGKVFETSFSDEEDSAQNYCRPGLSQRQDAEQGQMRCLAEHILSALHTPPLQNGRIKTEEECIRAWAETSKCSCLHQNFVRNTRKVSSFKRPHRYMPPMDTFPRRLMYETDIRQTPCQVDVSQHKLEDDSDDDEFFTPPQSPENVSRCSSPIDMEEDMATPEEGVDVYIEGEAPTKMDLTVMQAIQGCDINPVDFPNIYRWRHAVLLHSVQERTGWPSPLSRAKARTSTPEKSQRWQKITGPFSPMSPLQ